MHKGLLVCVPQIPGRNYSSLQAALLTSAVAPQLHPQLSLALNSSKYGSLTPTVAFALAQCMMVLSVAVS